jgi:hypothetical protein
MQQMTWEEFCQKLSVWREIKGDELNPIIVTPPTGIPRTCCLTQIHWTDSVKIEHVIFEGSVDFSGMFFDSSLQVENCKFPFGLKLANTRVAGILSLRGCEFCNVPQPNTPWLDWRGLEVEKIFTCAFITSQVGICLANSKFGDDIRFDASCISSFLIDEKIASRFADSFEHPEEKKLTKFLTGFAVHLEGATIQASLYFDSVPGRQTTIRGVLDLRARIAGAIMFCGTKISMRGYSAGFPAICCNRADIGGSVFFTPGESDSLSKYRFECEGQIDLRARIGGQISFQGSYVSVKDIEEADGIAIDCDGADIGSSVFFRPGEKDNNSKYRFECEGQIDLRAKIADQVSFYGTRVSIENIQDANDIAILCNGADILGSVFFWPGANERFECVGDVKCFAMRCLAMRVGACIFQGHVDFSYFESANDFVFEGESQFQKDFSLEHATINGNLKINKSATVEMHSLNCAHAVINGDVEMKYVNHQKTLVGSGDWNFDSVKIEGNLRLNGSCIPGSLSLEDAEIQGELNMTESKVEGHLSMRSSIVTGRVFAHETSRQGSYPQVKGQVDLSYSTLNQIDIAIEGSTATNTTNPSYIPESIILTGTKAKTFTVKHKTNATEKIPLYVVNGFSTSEVKCEGFRYLNPSSFSDFLRYGISGLLAGVTACANGFNGLPAMGIGITWGCYVAVLAEVSRRASPRQSVVANDSNGENNETESAWSLLDWLKTTKFDRGFYLDMETMARDEGDDRLADEIFFTRRCEESNRYSFSWPEKVWHGLLNFSLGYGVRTTRIWIFFLHLWVLNSVVFSNPRSVERPLTFLAKLRTETHTYDKVADQKDPMHLTENASDQVTKKVSNYLNPWDGNGGEAEAEEWTFVDGVLMAMRIQLPLLPLIAESDWEPASEPILPDKSRWAWFTYENYASGMIFINIILFPLLIGSATGFLKRLK